MIKCWIFLFLFLGLNQAQAVSVIVKGKWGEVLLKEEQTSALPSTVGQVTVDILDRLKMDYKGGVYGMSELFTLGSDIEVLSDTEMKAYGWCFSIDGVTTGTMADETPVVGQSSVIEWYYAYAGYKDGDWISVCAVDYPSITSF